MAVWKSISILVFALSVGASAAQAGPRPVGALTTDKTAYKPKETIRFTLTNDSQDAMMWGMSLYPTVWRRLPNGKEEIVREEPLIGLDALTLLESGASFTWEWDQRDYHQKYSMQDPPQEGTQVPNGKYIARFTVMPAGDFETKAFTIGSYLAVQPRGKLAVTWARLKGTP